MRFVAEFKRVYEATEFQSQIGRRGNSGFDAKLIGTKVVVSVPLRGRKRFLQRNQKPLEQLGMVLESK